MPTPPAQNFSTFQIGTWNPATDTWTLLYDLNQPTTGPVWVMNSYPQWTAGDKYDSRSTTIRAVGERIVETNLKNGHWKVKISIRGASTSAIAATVRTIAQALEQQQLCIRYAAPNATQYLYFDVRKTTHNLHQAPAQQIIAGIQSGNIDFECYPLARGDRTYLQNLAVNPGFESPSGIAIQVFNDSFATTNAYTTLQGTAPTLASNVMTVPSGTWVQFGSPAWGPVNQWLVRFKWVTGLTAGFDLHFTNANNKLQLQITSGSQGIYQFVGGTAHALATATATLTNGNFYWAQIVQYPTVSGIKPTVVAFINNDSAGVPGSLVTTIGPATTFDAVTALIGAPVIEASGAALAVGGAFSNVHILTLWGPGGWLFVGTNGTGPTSGAWEQTAGNCYPNGPVSSTGAARIDVPPAGTVDAWWWSFGGGSSPLGQPAYPVNTVGNVIQASVWTKSTSGLNATHATLNLNIVEFNASGTVLRQTTVATLTGPQTSWVQMTGSVTTGANTAYVSLQLRLTDTSVAGESAGATVWFDNVQCWDQTFTSVGSGAMPYCELRFAQSPAQLLVSGLLGDQPAPVLLSFGTFEGTFNKGQSLTFAIGRKATTGINARMVTGPYIPPGNTLASYNPNSGAYGGVYVSQNGIMGSYITPALGINVPMPDTQGLFHLLALMQTAETSLSALLIQYQSAQQDPALPTVFGLSTLLGPLVTPFTLASTWQPLDLGLVQLPNYPMIAESTQNVFTWNTWLNIDDSAGTNAQLVGWMMLLPYDAETLLGQVLNPTGYQNVSNQWLWCFSDGLTLSQRTTFAQAWQIEAIGTTLNLPNTPVALPQYAVSGPGVSTGVYPAINPTGSSFLRIDPTQTTPNSGGLGVNQFAALITDNTGAVLPFYADIQYSPYYYYQR